MAKVIVPACYGVPVWTIDVGEHFVMRRSEKAEMAVYQVVSNDPGIFLARTSDKMPVLNCATGCIRMVKRDAVVHPVDMTLAPTNGIKK